MDKGRKLSLIFVLVGGVIGLFGGLVMCFTGIAFIKILGINLLEWGTLFEDLAVLLMISYDTFEIGKQRKAFGEILFGLSSFTFQRQLLGLGILIVSLAFQLVMFILAPNILTGSYVYLIAGLVYIFAIHNVPKWGVYAKGIGIGGVYFDWTRVTCFKMNTSMVEMQVQNQLLWFKYESRIKCRYDSANEAELRGFLKANSLESTTGKLPIGCLK